MALHLDHLPMQLPDWLSERGDFTQPPQILTAQLYLSDIDHHIGPTWIVPGSHRAARPPQAGEQHWQGREAQPVLCKAGDALVFRSDVWHSGGANCTRITPARHASSALWPAHGRAEVFAIPELAFQPAGTGGGHTRGKGACWASTKKRNTTECCCWAWQMLAQGISQWWQFTFNFLFIWSIIRKVLLPVTGVDASGHRIRSRGSSPRLPYRPSGEVIDENPSSSFAGCCSAGLCRGESGPGSAGKRRRWRHWPR
ncbi:phytanoyl-CoA dioxygenase [Pseudomonas putida S11]|nr:phytanoyl-CoA dioxygenase [Pseudomonas putida S11]